jgi:CAAX prenyl protease-like protein
VATPAFLTHPALPRIAPFAVFIAFVAAQSLLTLDPAAQRWLVVGRDLTVAALLVIFRGRYSELRGTLRGPLPGQRVKPIDCILAIVVGLAVFFAWIHLDRPGLAFEGGPGFDPRRPDGRIDWMLAGLRLLALAVVIPVMEELFWRSFLLRWIDSRDFLARDPRRASWPAVAISCALFASEHTLWFAGLLAGVAYTALYMRSRNLWIPILSHATTNGTLGLWILATDNWRYW